MVFSKINNSDSVNNQGVVIDDRIVVSNPGDDKDDIITAKLIIT